MLNKLLSDMIQKTILDREIHFDLHTPNKEFSLIRLRYTINTNDKRLEYYLPLEYKIRPKYWDKKAGCTMLDSKRNGDLKNDPRLRLHLTNVNTEIMKTGNTLIDILLEIQRKSVKPDVSGIRSLLREKMGRV